MQSRGNADCVVILSRGTAHEGKPIKIQTKLWQLVNMDRHGTGTPIWPDHQSNHTQLKFRNTISVSDTELDVMLVVLAPGTRGAPDSIRKI
jgi:hypothetical protein